MIRINAIKWILVHFRVAKWKKGKKSVNLFALHGFLLLVIHVSEQPRAHAGKTVTSSSYARSC